MDSSDDIRTTNAAKGNSLTEDLVRHAANEERFSAKAGAVFFLSIFAFGAFCVYNGFWHLGQDDPALQDGAGELMVGGAIALILGGFGAWACIRGARKIGSILERH